MISIMRFLREFLLICLFIFPATLGFTSSLKERFYKAAPGDYIVTLQSKNYSVLIIRSVNESQLVLEEITIPEEESAKKGALSWKEWVKKGADGHTSWILYEMDLLSNKLKKCYSKKKMALIYPEESDYLFAKFLSLQVRRVRDEERKKIGPPPLGDDDHRRLWNPPLIIEGKTVAKPEFEVMQAKWPSDGTQLSNCTLDFYLDRNRPFPFPYWIEIESSHYTLKVRIVDSGSGM